MKIPQSGHDAFLVWSYSDPSKMKATPMRNAVEKHFRTTLARIEGILGDAELDGIVLSDDPERALSISHALRAHSRNPDIPREGILRDSDFPGGIDLASLNEYADKDYSPDGAIVGRHLDGMDKILALPEATATWATPLGLTHNPAAHWKAIGTVAHEMGHAAHSAKGCPGRPDRTFILDHPDPVTAGFLFECLDIAYEEFQAVRAECAVQKQFFGGVHYETFNDIDASSLNTAADLSAIAKIHQGGNTPSDTGAQSYPELMQMMAYEIGTLCGYKAADTVFLSKGGRPSNLSLPFVLKEQGEMAPELGKMLDILTPAMLEASSTPAGSEASRNMLGTFINAASQIGASPSKSTYKAPSRRTQKKDEVSI